MIDYDDINEDFIKTLKECKMKYWKKKSLMYAFEEIRDLTNEDEYMIMIQELIITAVYFESVKEVKELNRRNIVKNLLLERKRVKNIRKYVRETLIEIMERAKNG